ncbi:MAG: hypothetical protein QXP38_05890 [Nitrososphaerota archaeon]
MIPKLATLRKLLKTYEDYYPRFLKISELVEKVYERYRLNKRNTYNALRFLKKHGLLVGFYDFCIYEERNGRKIPIKRHNIKLDVETLRLVDSAPTRYSLLEKIEWAKKQAEKHRIREAFFVDYLIFLLLNSDLSLYIPSSEVFFDIECRDFPTLWTLEKLKKKLKGKTLSFESLRNLNEVSEDERSIILDLLKKNLAESKLCIECFKQGKISMRIRGRCSYDELHVGSVTSLEACIIMNKKIVSLKDIKIEGQKGGHGNSSLVEREKVLNTIEQRETVH